MRKRRGERAYVFDKDLVRCLAQVEREDWEFTIGLCRGNVALAAEECGIRHVPKGAKVLWGVSAQEALNTYRRWQQQRSK